MINCIVVDDEPLARQLIISYVDQIPDMQCTGNYDNAVDAFAALHSQQVDVIFIDIEMPGITGLNFVRSLKVQPKVIFITAYTEYAVDAFELEAADYLVKPVIFERFLKAVQKIMLIKNEAIQSTQQNTDTSCIFLKVDRRLVKIDFASILYIEGLGDYLKVHTTDQTFVSYMSLGKIEKMLPPAKFVRIHRSTIVHKTFIKFIEGNFVRIHESDLSIGLTYRDGLLKTLGSSS